MNITVPTEHEEQREFIKEFRRGYPGVLIFAVPNGGYRGKVQAGKLKAEGVTRGIPDMYIPEWRLWVEMKRQKGGVLSQDQKDVIKYLESIGDKCMVTKGWEDAMEQIKLYRSGLI